jgi:hypothetical protein
MTPLLYVLVLLVLCFCRYLVTQVSLPRFSSKLPIGIWAQQSPCVCVMRLQHYQSNWTNSKECDQLHFVVLYDITWGNRFASTCLLDFYPNLVLGIWIGHDGYLFLTVFTVPTRFGLLGFDCPKFTMATPPVSGLKIDDFYCTYWQSCIWTSLKIKWKSNTLAD